MKATTILPPFQTSVRLPGGRLWRIPAHRIDGYGHDVEETGLALCDPAPGTVHERADGLAQGLLTVALAEHLLRNGQQHGAVCDCGRLRWLRWLRWQPTTRLCSGLVWMAQYRGEDVWSRE